MFAGWPAIRLTSSVTRSAGCGHRPKGGRRRTGHAYQGVRPSRKKVQRVCHEINDLVQKLPTFNRPEAVVCQVNQVLRGWTNYFQYGTVSPAYRAVHQHAMHRVRQWLQRKFKLRGRGIRHFPDAHLESILGLFNPTRLRSNFSHAKGVKFWSESRMPEIGPSGSRSGE
jgi:hypothetical protein